MKTILMLAVSVFGLISTPAFSKKNKTEMQIAVVPVRGETPIGGLMGSASHETPDSYHRDIEMRVRMADVRVFEVKIHTNYLRVIRPTAWEGKDYRENDITAPVYLSLEPGERIESIMVDAIVLGNGRSANIRFFGRQRRGSPQVICPDFNEGSSSRVCKRNEETEVREKSESDWRLGKSDNSSGRDSGRDSDDQYRSGSTQQSQSQQRDRDGNKPGNSGGGKKEDAKGSEIPKPPGSGNPFENDPDQNQSQTQGRKPEGGNPKTDSDPKSEPKSETDQRQGPTQDPTQQNQKTGQTTPKDTGGSDSDRGTGGQDSQNQTQRQDQSQSQEDGRKCGGYYSSRSKCVDYDYSDERRYRQRGSRDYEFQDLRSRVERFNDLHGEMPDLLHYDYDTDYERYDEDYSSSRYRRGNRYEGRRTSRSRRSGRVEATYGQDGYNNYGGYQPQYQPQNGYGYFPSQYPGPNSQLPNQGDVVRF